MRSALLHPLAPLILFSISCAIQKTTYLWFGLAIPSRADDFQNLCWPLLLLLWADADARYRRQVPCFDFGFLCAVSMPLSLLWYSFWSRGWRAFLLLLGLFGLFLYPHLVAVVVWQFLYGKT